MWTPRHWLNTYGGDWETNNQSTSKTHRKGKKKVSWHVWKRWRKFEKYVFIIKFAHFLKSYLTEDGGLRFFHLDPLLTKFTSANESNYPKPLNTYFAERLKDKIALCWHLMSLTFRLHQSRFHSSIGESHFFTFTTVKPRAGPRRHVCSNKIQLLTTNSSLFCLHCPRGCSDYSIWWLPLSQDDQWSRSRMLFGATVINAETFVFSDMTTVTPVQQHLSIEINQALLGERKAAIILNWAVTSPVCVRGTGIGSHAS